MSTETTPSPGTRTAPPPARFPAFLRAAAVLVPVGAIACGLALLGELDHPMPLVETFRDASGDQVSVILENRAPRGFYRFRAIIARRPFELEGRGDLVRIHGGENGARTRVLPPGGTILIDRAGRIEALDAPLPVHVLRLLQMAPPAAGETLRGWFRKADVLRALEAARWDPDALDRLWR